MHLAAARANANHATGPAYCWSDGYILGRDLATWPICNLAKQLGQFALEVLFIKVGEVTVDHDVHVISYTVYIHVISCCLLGHLALRLCSLEHATVLGAVNLRLRLRVGGQQRRHHLDGFTIP